MRGSSPWNDFCEKLIDNCIMNSIFEKGIIFDRE